MRARVSEHPLIAVTAGEPAGIGPDLCVMLARRRLPARIVVVADRGLLEARARQLGLAPRMGDFSVQEKPLRQAGGLLVRHVPLSAPAAAGRLDPANSEYVMRTLELAAQGCSDGTFDAMVTGPVQKSVINQAGIAFTGHTEFLAEHLRAPHVVMMLVGGGLRVALATTHIPLGDVASRITRADLERTLIVLRHDLVERFAIARPRIAVAALNPHAGEGGFLGREEIEIITPVIARLRRRGFNLAGPLPADTLFTPQRLKAYDCVLAMYHDQGLPVLKYASFGTGVNVTLGLPIIRTSVDHGTALELAGRGKADIGSLLEAITLAAQLAVRARRR
ncbi:MAG: 4-hydroxythreonine-4-phosphate dehydrogenase [Betaproteobacteria bacterium SG8_41]|nr:MAG: 4-hydroxythreonine-4-phosphate dehydrogenase [Betaproteobacteria bacterium SG8_41]